MRTIVKNFKPDAVIGVGGYSSFPVLRFAQVKNIPSFIHESNSFAGKSNILLAKKATKVFVATDGMEKFFPKEKLVITGNPVRETISSARITREDGIRFFSLNVDRKTVLIVGGSLGAKSINEATDRFLDDLLVNELQVIWQTGKSYAEKAKERAAGKAGVWVNDFIANMEYAYAAADIVMARAGAMTVAELCVVKKPVLFIPYPFAAEDHQTMNAKSLVDKSAALMVKDSAAMDKAIPAIIALSKDEAEQKKLKENIGRLAITDADQRIAAQVLQLI